SRAGRKQSGMLLLEASRLLLKPQRSPGSALSAAESVAAVESIEAFEAVECVPALEANQPAPGMLTRAGSGRSTMTGGVTSSAAWSEKSGAVAGTSGRPSLRVTTTEVSRSLTTLGT